MFSNPIYGFIRRKWNVVGVLKEGLFFDNKYANIRKCLVDKFNVYKVVSVPSDQFENTTTKTSIIFFKNDGQTKQIEFCELVVNKENIDEYDVVKKDDVMELQLVKIKDKIASVSDRIVATATYKEIAAQTVVRGKKKYLYSLSYKKYVKGNEIKCNKGYELVKLGDIAEINPINKKFIDAKYYVELSDVNDNQITNKQNIDKVNIKANAKKTVEKNDILIATVRPKKQKCFFINKNFDNKKYVFSSAFASIRIKDISEYDPFYIYVMLLENEIDNFEKKYCEGSTYPRFKPEILNNIKIPIPKSQTKLKEWVKKISAPYDKLQESRTKLKELESEVQVEIKRICDEEECLEEKLGDVCDIKAPIRRKKFETILYK